jgi:hypothetical protein
LNAEHHRNELIVKFVEENWMEFAFELVKVDRDNMQLFIEKRDTEVFIIGINIHQIFSVLTRLRGRISLFNAK